MCRGAPHVEKDPRMTPRQVRVHRTPEGHVLLYIPPALATDLDVVWVYREGGRLIVQPVTTPYAPGGDLLAWLEHREPLAPEDEFPEIEDPPPEPRSLF